MSVHNPRIYFYFATIFLYPHETWLHFHKEEAEKVINHVKTFRLSILEKLFLTTLNVFWMSCELRMSWLCKVFGIFWTANLQVIYIIWKIHEINNIHQNKKKRNCRNARFTWEMSLSFLPSRSKTELINNRTEQKQRKVVIYWLFMGLKW